MYDDRTRSSRRRFSAEEDAHLRSFVATNESPKWEDIAARLQGRTARQCRDRYTNYLAESLVTNPWTPEEDALLSSKVRELGPRWSRVSPFFPGRSNSNVKNRWHKHVSKPAPAPKPPQTDKPVINLCEAIGVKDCDLAAIFTQFSGPYYWGTHPPFGAGGPHV
jgi:hypothetical protein